MSTHGVLGRRFKRYRLLAIAVVSLTIVLVLQTGGHVKELKINSGAVSVSGSHLPSKPRTFPTSVYGVSTITITTHSPSHTYTIQKYLAENVRNLPLENKLHQKLLRMDEYIASLKSHLPNEYISELRNPCWYSDFEIPSVINQLKFPGVSQKLDENSVKLKEKYIATYQTSNLRVPIRAHSESSRERNLYCLPYFFLLGYAKTGTTTLYSLITKFNLFASPVSKELHWWAWYPYQTTEPLSSLYFKRYLAHFVPAAFSISKYTKRITGDCSVLAAYSLPFRTTTTSVLPGFMPYMYSQLFKQQRFIIVMRDPVLSVRSGFYYFNIQCFASLKRNGVLSNSTNKYDRDDKIKKRYWLHLAVLQHTTAFNKCMELTRGDGSICIYDYKNHIVPDKRIPSCIFLNMGSSIYYYSLYYWLHYIPKERFLLIRTEELSNQSKILHQLASFLDLPLPINAIKNTVTGMSFKNQGVSAASNSSVYMSHETERNLVEFFAPYNQQLARLLNDENYLWKDQIYSSI